MLTITITEDQLDLLIDEIALSASLAQLVKGRKKVDYGYSIEPWRSPQVDRKIKNICWALWVITHKVRSERDDLIKIVTSRVRETYYQRMDDLRKEQIDERI